MTSQSQIDQFATEAEQKKQIMEILAQKAGLIYTDEDSVNYHTDSPKVSLPGKPVKMSKQQAGEALMEMAQADRQTESYAKTFRYRPLDGAHATMQVLKEAFGSTGRGQAQKSFFGVEPPETVTVDVGPNGETADVPQGQLNFAPLDAVLYLGAENDPNFGELFRLTVECPKANIPLVHALFEMIGEYLSKFSIYKGKAICGVERPLFLQLTDDNTIVYAKETRSALDLALWDHIRFADNLRKAGIKVNTRVLLDGPYGTGKSEAGSKTAKVCTENGWTFIQFESGKQSLDDLEKVVTTAKLYAPAVVFIEDADVYASNPDPSYQTRLTNLLDGLGSKGSEVMIVMTSNDAESFRAGMLRSRRIDNLIHVGMLDKEAVQTLLTNLVGAQRLETLDYERIWQAVQHYEPSFIRSVIDQARKAAILRSGEPFDYKLSTEDLETTAHLLHPQWALHHSAAVKKPLLGFDQLFSTVVKRSIKEMVETGDWPIMNGTDRYLDLRPQLQQVPELLAEEVEQDTVV